MGKMHLLNLPEELLCSQILTRLPLKEAVRFSAVSRKWCRVWTQLPHLKFSNEFFDSVCATPTKRRAVSKLTRQNKAVDIINKIILMHCLGPEIFELDNCDRCESSIHKWLLWISLSGVKCIDLKSRGIRMEVSKSLFSCLTITSLSLENFMMINVPALFQGFSQLEKCNLEDVELSEEAFKVILEFCRLLQSLTLDTCILPSNLRIISSSLTSLALLGCDNCSMEVNCPRLESIKITQCYRLVIGNICLPVCVNLETDFPLLQHFATLKSLRKITCFIDAHATFSSFKVLESFPHLEEFCIDYPYFFQSYPEDVEESTLQLANLKSFTVNIVFRGHFKRIFLLCSCILKGAPLLKTVRIGMDYYTLEAFGSDDYLQFVNDISSLAKGFPKTKISV